MNQISKFNLGELNIGVNVSMCDVLLTNKIEGLEFTRMMFAMPN